MRNVRPSRVRVGVRLSEAQLLGRRRAQEPARPSLEEQIAWPPEFDGRGRRRRRRARPTETPATLLRGWAREQAPSSGSSKSLADAPRPRDDGRRSSDAPVDGAGVLDARVALDGRALKLVVVAFFQWARVGGVAGLVLIASVLQALASVLVPLQKNKTYK